MSALLEQVKDVVDILQPGCWGQLPIVGLYWGPG